MTKTLAKNGNHRTTAVFVGGADGSPASTTVSPKSSPKEDWKETKERHQNGGQND